MAKEHELSVQKSNSKAFGNSTIHFKSQYHFQQDRMQSKLLVSLALSLHITKKVDFFSLPNFEDKKKKSIYFMFRKQYFRTAGHELGPRRFRDFFGNRHQMTARYVVGHV